MDTPAGVVVTDVAPSTFADHVGLQKGDIIVEIGGAAVYRAGRELYFFTREHAAGEEAEVAWIRDGELLAAALDSATERTPQSPDRARADGMSDDCFQLLDFGPE